jgi:hypothetical protein
VSDQPLLHLRARCQFAKLLDEFPIKNAARGTYRSYCRPCCRECGKEHYERNLSYYKAKLAVARIRDRAANRAIVDAFLSHPCVNCGESDVVVLEFDHRVPADKVRDVGGLASRRVWVSVLKEIEKCDVRCVNCHRRKTARQFKWGKLSRRIE